MLNVFGKEESSEGGSSLDVNPKESILKSFSWSSMETTYQIGEDISRNDLTGGQSGVLSWRTYNLE